MKDRIYYPLVICGLLVLFLIGTIEDKTEGANITGYITNIIPEYNEVLVVDKENVLKSGNPDATWVSIKDDTVLERKRWLLSYPINFDKLEIGQQVSVVESNSAFRLLHGRESADTFVVTKSSKNSEDLSGEITAITPLSETEFHFDEGIYVTVGNESFVITQYCNITDKRGKALYYTDIEVRQMIKVWISIPNDDSSPIIAIKVEVMK